MEDNLKRFQALMMLNNHGDLFDLKNVGHACSNGLCLLYKSQFLCLVFTAELNRDKDEQMSHAGVLAPGPVSRRNRRPPIYLQTHPSCLMTLPTVTGFQQESCSEHDGESQDCQQQQQRGDGAEGRDALRRIRKRKWKVTDEVCEG